MSVDAPSLKHHVSVVTAQDLVTVGGEGLGGSGAAMQLLNLIWWAPWAVDGEDVYYQDQHWTSCVVGCVFGCLQQTYCRV